MDPLDLTDLPQPEFILNMDEGEDQTPVPQGLKFSPPAEGQTMSAPPVQPNQPMAPMGAAPAAPVGPRPKPAPVAKATGGYSSLKQSQSSSQDPRADSLFGG